MSLILDALKKAEAERQRHSGPTLLEVRVTSPRRRFPLWTWIIGGLLGVNAVLLLAFALHRPAPSVLTAASEAPAGSMAAIPASPAPAGAPAGAAASAAPPGVAPAAAAVSPPPQNTAATNTADPGISGPALAGILPAAAPPGPAQSPGAAYDEDSQNPADNEPAVPAQSATKRNERSPHAPSSRELPNLADIGGDMPDLRLDLHVYAERAGDRYALINMHTVHEGDVLPEGPRVVQIYRDGVAMSYHGIDFMLRPQ